MKNKENLPTKEEYAEYLSFVALSYCGVPVGMTRYERFLYLEKKVKNIKFPATIDEINKQLL